MKGTIVSLGRFLSKTNMKLHNCKRRNYLHFLRWAIQVIYIRVKCAKRKRKSYIVIKSKDTGNDMSIFIELLRL